MIIYKLDAMSFLISMLVGSTLLAVIFPLANNYLYKKFGKGYKKMLEPCDGKYFYIFLLGCSGAIIQKVLDQLINSIKYYYYVNHSDFQNNERTFFYVVILVFSIKMMGDIFLYFKEKEKEKD